MKPEEIHLYDIGRILIGEVPGGFLLEAVLRILFLFLMLLVAIRLMGRRMASSLTRNELAALTSLAAAIGVPVLAPDRGLLPALIIAVVVIAFQRLMAGATFRSKKMERVLMDHNNILIEDGCINQQEILKSGLSQERLFAQLRSSGIDSLGKVQRLYFEPSGRFTILEAPEPAPGLPILPEWDTDYTDDRETLPDKFACCNCGQIVKETAKPDRPCERCGQNEWRQAVK
jgi:uncharacterized membrane protein YcaP (DUF421 family)